MVVCAPFESGKMKALFDNLLFEDYTSAAGLPPAKGKTLRQVADVAAMINSHIIEAWGRNIE